MIKNFIKKEPVLVVSFLVMLCSILICPISLAYIDYIDFKTLSCLFCLMVSIKGFERMGILTFLADRIQRKIHTARMLAVFLVFSCFFSAMLMTNDVALIAIVPLTILLLKSCRQEKQTAYIIVLQTMAANIGSSLTPIGNPQNLYLFFRYNMKIAEFIIIMLPYVAAGLLMLLILCFFVHNTSFDVGKAEIGEKKEEQKMPVKLAVLYVGLLLISILTVFGVIPVLMAVVVVSLCVIICDRKTLASIDYSLLLTFLSIFIFVGNVSSLQTVHRFVAQMIEQNVILVSVITSQFISNVPAAILLSEFTNQARELLIAVNIGGLGTLIASMASVISFKLYAKEYQEKTISYIGLFTLLNVIGLALLLGVAHQLC